MGSTEGRSPGADSGPVHLGLRAQPADGIAEVVDLRRSEDLVPRLTATLAEEAEVERQRANPAAAKRSAYAGRTISLTAVMALAMTMAGTFCPAGMPSGM